MPRVLITGVAGFIGMHTALRFLNEGWYVIGLDNLNDYYSVELKKDRLSQIQELSEQMDIDFRFFKADLNSNVWNECREIEIDAVIHLAAQAGVRYSIENPLAYLDSNVLGFQKVLDFVVETKIQKFLYASSSSVYGKNSSQPFNENEPCNEPESYYAATKRANELMAFSYSKTHNLHSIGMRFFTVYGPWGRPDMAPMLFAKAYLTGEKIKVFNFGNQARDFTFVDDVIEGIYRLTLKKEFAEKALVCNIGSGRPERLMAFISAIEESMGLKQIEKELVGPQRGDVEVTYANTSKLKSLVNYHPNTYLNEGIEKFIRWYKEYYRTTL